MNPELSRRVARVMHASMIMSMDGQASMAFARAIDRTKDFYSLPKQYQRLILQAESELSGGQVKVKKAVKFLGYKARSDNLVLVYRVSKVLDTLASSLDAQQLRDFLDAMNEAKDFERLPAKYRALIEQAEE